MAVPRPVTLPLTCPHCGGALSVEIQRWEDESPAPPPVELLTDDPTGEELPEEGNAITTFVCPYCQKLNHGRLGGTFHWVTKRTDDESKARH